jgi:hypothetical protein
MEEPMGFDLTIRFTGLHFFLKDDNDPNVMHVLTVDARDPRPIDDEQNDHDSQGKKVVHVAHVPRIIVDVKYVKSIGSLREVRAETDAPASGASHIELSWILRSDHLELRDGATPVRDRGGNLDVVGGCGSAAAAQVAPAGKTDFKNLPSIKDIFKNATPPTIRQSIVKGGMDRLAARLTLTGGEFSTADVTPEMYEFVDLGTSAPSHHDQKIATTTVYKTTIGADTATLLSRNHKEELVLGPKTPGGSVTVTIDNNPLSLEDKRAAVSPDVLEDVDYALLYRIFDMGKSRKRVPRLPVRVTPGHPCTGGCNC